MSKKRRQYTEEFKESAVKLVTEQGYRYSEASRNLGVNVSVLRRWKKAMEVSNGKSSVVPEVETLHAELARLKKENHRLKQERDILKKAAAFFANESGSGIE